MRHKQTLSDQDLQNEARELLKGLNHSRVARELGMHRSTISNAINSDTPSRYASTLVRIIEHLTEYRIRTETITRHRVMRK